MLQDILTWIVIGICVLVAGRMVYRRFWGKRKKACDCGCGGNTVSRNPDDCRKEPPSADYCGGCALWEQCNPKSK